MPNDLGASEIVKRSGIVASETVKRSGAVETRTLQHIAIANPRIQG